MATIRDIAREAGVSVGTASRAITGNGYVSDETKMLVLETAKKLHYSPKEKSIFQQAFSPIVQQIEIRNNFCLI